MAPARLAWQSLCFPSATSLLILLAASLSMTVQARPGALIDLVNEQESRLQARIGMAVVNLETGQRIEYRANELFPLSSTFKPLACAALLQRVDAGLESLDRRIIFDSRDLVDYSPLTGTRTGAAGMSLAELCQATISLSDNTAGNLILQAIDGPASLTRFLRNIGDDVTRLDRQETELNEATPGDPRDTTSPAAMVNTLKALLFDEILSPDSRRQLETWLQGNLVGDALFRATIPESWQIGDKTGAGGYGSRSITAVLRPPSGSPIIAAVYITQTEADFAERNAAIAEIGRAIAESAIISQAVQLSP